MQLRDAVDNYPLKAYFNEIYFHEAIFTNPIKFEYRIKYMFMYGLPEYMLGVKNVSRGRRCIELKFAGFKFQGCHVTYDIRHCC